VHLVGFTTEIYILDINIIRNFMSALRAAYSVDTRTSNTRIANTRDVLLAISFYFVITYSIH
jgi:hypothetical protein